MKWKFHSLNYLPAQYYPDKYSNQMETLKHHLTTLQRRHCTVCGGSHGDVSLALTLYIFIIYQHFFQTYKHTLDPKKSWHCWQDTRLLCLSMINVNVLIFQHAVGSTVVGVGEISVQQILMVSIFPGLKLCACVRATVVQDQSASGEPLAVMAVV